jgi:type III secretory pathway component EscT
VCLRRWKRSLSQVKENQPFASSLEDFVLQSFWRSVFVPCESISNPRIVCSFFCSVLKVIFARFCNQSFWRSVCVPYESIPDAKLHMQYICQFFCKRYAMSSDFAFNAFRRFVFLYLYLEAPSALCCALVVPFSIK